MSSHKPFRRENINPIQMGILKAPQEFGDQIGSSGLNSAANILQ